MRRITQKDLQALYPPVSDDMSRRMESFLAELPERKEQVRVKKKFSTAAVLVAALILITVGAVAAALNWDVVQYLFTGTRDDLAAYQQNVNAAAENEWVRASVNSVLYDGHFLAFDLSCENLDPSWPVFVQVINQPRVNGTRTTGLSSYHIVGWCYDEQPVRREGGGGLIIEDTPFTVTIKITCLRPKKKTKVLINPDPQEKTQWMTDGYHIVEPEMKRADGTTFWRMIPEKYWEFYDVQNLDLSFEVMPPKNVKNVALHPAQESYETPEFTGYYRTILRTPMCVYAEFVQIPTEKALQKENYWERAGNINWNVEQDNDPAVRRPIAGNDYETVENGQTVFIRERIYLITEDGVPEKLCLEWRPMSSVGYLLDRTVPLPLK